MPIDERSLSTAARHATRASGDTRARRDHSAPAGGQRETQCSQTRVIPRTTAAAGTHAASWEAINLPPPLPELLGMSNSADEGASVPEPEPEPAVLPATLARSSAEENAQLDAALELSATDMSAQAELVPAAEGEAEPPRAPVGILKNRKNDKPHTSPPACLDSLELSLFRACDRACESRTLSRP
eukprot:COSAG03_NODE_8076_length_839_cov_1.248649_1_plen_184_part_10